MRVRPLTLLATGNVALLAGAVAYAVATTRASHWEDLTVFFALMCMALASDALIVTVRNLRLSGAFSAMVLAMALLGPLPAMAIGLMTIALDAYRSRLPGEVTLSNLAAYGTFTLSGGLLMQELLPAARGVGAEITVVASVFVLSNVINFVVVWAHVARSQNRTWGHGVRDVFLPVIPAQLALGLLTAGVYAVSVRLGPGSVMLLGAILLVFQWLLRVALAASERGEQLEQRNEQLASLQVGLISTMLKTLSLRDHMTARHSAAVARYSSEMAKALGLDDDECELIHTAALFHDIGKFIFPDDILLADTHLTDEQYAIVKRHPSVGAELIAEIEGYGPVAEIVRHHHERLDGRGYPDGLAGEDIPLGSKIIAVADVYDVITARDTYRKPVSSLDAVAELRRCAGSQLDPRLVEIFVGLLEKEAVHFRHTSDADFEAELKLEVRVRDYALPKRAA